MSVDNYIKAQELAKRKLDTVLHEIRRSYDSALETLRGGEGSEYLIQMSKLNNPEYNTSFSKNFVEGLESKVETHFGKPLRDIIPDADAIDQMGLSELYFGFNPSTQIPALINLLKENATFDNVYNPITKGISDGQGGGAEPMIANLKRRINDYPSSQLTQEDGEDVVKYTKTVDRIDPTKLTIKDMAELIDMYNAQENINFASLKGKPYLINNSN